MEVFGPEVREKYEQKFAGRPEWERPDLWFVLTSPQRASLRHWIDDRVMRLPEPGRTSLVARLRDDRSFVSSYHELAAAAVFLDAGLTVEYEPTLLGRTPDLLVTSAALPRPIIAEVWTRSLPRERLGERRAWQALIHRVREIPVGVGLLVEGIDAGYLLPPNSRQAKQVAAALKAWLLGWVRVPGDSIEVEAYRFRVVTSLPGLSAHVATPGRGGVVDTDDVVAAISEKVSRYARVANDLDAHLLIVTGAEPDAPLDRALLRQALTGQQSFAVSIPLGATGLVADWSAKMLAEHRPPIFHDALSAVGWLDVDPAAADTSLVVTPMSTAARSFRPIPGAHLTIDDQV